MTKEKKAQGIGIKLRLIGLSVSNGFTDYNDYVDSLLLLIQKLKDQNASYKAELDTKNDDKKVSELLKAVPDDTNK